uniref:Alkylglycerone-phosphate synthase n=1 Tax=Chromera velia CCMP2878 TaxID=1169474 RepID=A0A0G4HA09_9ALVE|eukprot:Cvel_25550.t1-p1 / transcript=Cvel_25550.t1 / gene=Cvel_25550 / organism=Chromera_velia_CCMP2878 / gene_product=Alkyldihydroxyacetonephosphate synthase,, putative / transcript_product=Alkyldihydroxyacetonephosphate synthase,, putative / location=Cvel_scaffold2909:7952-12992(-) / protein_length=600 / sequence_SO=supercontig / SO=protein_coding / is_pseudo=false
MERLGICGFCVQDEGEDLVLLGKRYELNTRPLKSFKKFVEDTLGLDFRIKTPPQERIKLPPKQDCSAFLDKLRGGCRKHGRSILFSDEGADRLLHGHGQSCEDMWRLRYGTFERLPDGIVYPSCQEEVIAVVKAATESSTVLVPFGGGTSVTLGLSCPENETRPIVALDMSKMNRILWVDPENLLAKVEGGVVGAFLEEELGRYGLTTGHEPDSIELSTVGGWVATRASGMKRNRYGNIEDLVVDLTAVTPTGVLSARGRKTGRVSEGPEVQNLMLGSEGTLGVVTDVTMRLRPKAEAQIFASFVFPSLGAGVKFLREIESRGELPASIRLVDNFQFKFAVSLGEDAAAAKRGPLGRLSRSVLDPLKKTLITRVMGYDWDQIAAVTALFEGGKEEVRRQQKTLTQVARSHGGLPGGGENGSRGYALTFMIAYIRDLGLDHGWMGESFEMSLPWSGVLKSCERVVERVKRDSQREGVKLPPVISCRVTQSYSWGACVYFYIAIRFVELAEPLKVFHRLEEAAREEVSACGGSISHHHGIGKSRRPFYRDRAGGGNSADTGLRLLHGVKDTLDPSDVFGVQNLVARVSRTETEMRKQTPSRL